MKPRSMKTRSGFTLIEIMVGILVIVVGVLGAMMYRYHSALDARKGDLHMGATRMALLFLEDFKGRSGLGTFNSTNLDNLADLDISGTAPNYTATIKGGTGATYYITMPLLPTTVSLGGIDIKELEVTVYWSHRGTPSMANHTGKVELKDWTQ